MRAHGVPSFPDPGHDGAFTLPSGLDQQAPQFQRATTACANVERARSQSSTNLPPGPDLHAQARPGQPAPRMRSHGITNAWQTVHRGWIQVRGARPVEEEREQEQSTSISVMLIVPDADAAVAWYKHALGATELWNLGGVAGLEVDGAPFFLHEVNPDNPSETSPDRLAVTSTRIELFVDDPDRFMQRAIAAGASLGSELEDHEQPWGRTAKAAFEIRSDMSGPSATPRH